MTPEILVGGRSALARALVAEFEGAYERALGQRDRFIVAVPGGSVATNFFPALVRLPFDWSRVHVFWIDERAVAPSNAESNYGIARALWLEPAGVPAANAHRLHGDAANLDEAARDAERDLIETAGAPPVIDLALIGMGPDGHVASIFAGHPIFQESRALVAVVRDAPKPPPVRLTLTLPVLAASQRTVIVATGAEKASAVEKAAAGEETLPAGALVARSTSVRMLLDPAAASRL